MGSAPRGAGGGGGLERLRCEARAKLAASRRQVAGTLGTLVEEARAGVRMVGAGATATAELRGNFSMINALCTECSDLIEHHDLISQLTSAVHHLGVVIDEAQNVQAIPSRASMAQQILADPHMDLQEGYEVVSELEAASNFARAVLDSQSRRGGVQATRFEFTFAPYFEQVAETSRRFEELLWGRIANLVEEGKGNPASLVAAAKVIELQERRDLKTEGAGHPGRCKQWKEKLFQEVFAAIDTKFLTVHLKIQETLAESVEQRTMLGVLECADDIMSDLTDIYDYSAPCFPPHYCLFDRMQARYHVGFRQMLEKMGQAAHEFSNEDILQVVGWVRNYRELMLNLGVEETNCTFDRPGEAEVGSRDVLGLEAPSDSSRDFEGGEVKSLDSFLRKGTLPMAKPATVPTNGPLSREFGRDSGEGADVSPGAEGIHALMQVYLGRVVEQLHVWQRNIVQCEATEEPAADGEGRLYTPGAVDLFRILNEQVSIIAGFTRGEMVLEIARVVVNLAERFQDEQQASLTRLQGSGDIERLVTCINNNARNYNMCLELAETIEGTLDGEHKEEIDIDGACRGFLGVAKSAVVATALGIFEDPGLRDVMDSFFGGEWLNGRVTAVLMATLTDYMQDLQVWSDPAFFRRVVEAMLDQAGNSWVAALLLNTPVIDPDVLQRMEDDGSCIRELFQDHLPSTKLMKSQGLQVMDAVVEMAKSDSVDSFIINYRLVLEVQPECSPVLVEKLLTAREDISNRDAAEVMPQCREAFQEKNPGQRSGLLAKTPGTVKRRRRWGSMVIN